MLSLHIYILKKTKMPTLNTFTQNFTAVFRRTIRQEKDIYFEKNNNNMKGRGKAVFIHTLYHCMDLNNL